SAAWTPRVPSCSTVSSPACASAGRSSSPRTTPSGSRRWPAGGSRLRSYFADTATLARKDLRLELRARDTLPAMLLFVVAILVVSEVVALPAFALFFEPVGWSTVAGVLLADLGICAVGTLLAAMAAAGRARELLLPLLFLPLALPIVIGGVGASVVDGSGRYLGFLALYDAIFTLLAWASFEYVVTE